jgi:hypothetical protein
MFVVGDHELGLTVKTFPDSPIVSNSMSIFLSTSRGYVEIISGFCLMGTILYLEECLTR